MSGFFFSRYGDHRDLHVLTHSFPTRRSSDLDALTKILRQTFDIPDQRPGTSLKKEREEPSRPRKEPRDAPPFHPQRYPSAFRAKGGDGSEGGLKVYKLPAGG